MPVRLVAETERLEWKHEDTESGLIYRRISTPKQREIRAQYTKKGIVDEQGFMDAVVEYCALDWFGIIGEDGEKVPFSKEMIKYLPDLYKASFINALYAFDPKVAEQGN